MTGAADAPTVDRDGFRATMSRLASGVCVVTTPGGGGRAGGMTASAVCSVTDDPPSLLVVVNRSNRSHAAIEDAGAFTLNVHSAPFFVIQPG